METNTLRRSAVFALMSAFLAWHSLAILVAPVPPEATGLRPLLDLLTPYLEFLSLDNNWDFFAPNVRRGYQFRYVVMSADGTARTFVPIEDVSWFNPNYWWVRQWQDAIVNDTDLNGDQAVALLCRKHAALHPTAIALVKVEQKTFSPADWLAGKRPFDPGFLTAQKVTYVECQ